MKDYRILYEDKDLLAVYKPAGLATQSARATVPDLMSRLRREMLLRNEKTELKLVNRLDQPVEGILLVAKTRAAAADLSRQVSDHIHMEKWYRVLVCGKLPNKEGELVDYLLEDPRLNRSSICPPGTPGAKECRLTYRVLEEGEGWSLVEIRLFTGRRHQIRVQMAHAGAPVMGDRKYGRAEQDGAGHTLYGKADPGGAGLSLCSFKLVFRHPRTKAPLTFQVEPSFSVPPTAP